MIETIPVAAFSDNYIWLIPVPGKSGRDRVLVVDPGDAGPVIDYLERHDLVPEAILITHHHFDHVGGVKALVARYRVPVYGPARSPAQGIDHPLRDGDRLTFGEATAFTVLEVPGHTLDHIAYHGNGLLLCGDTLFAAGCGRLFEGSAEQMHASLSRLAALPGATRICCGHEYTLANLLFARAADPDNPAVAARLAAVRQLRANDRPTLPSTVDEEQATNPFLRCDQPALAAAASRHSGQPLSGATEVFAALRDWKDSFRPH